MPLVGTAARLLLGAAARSRHGLRLARRRLVALAAAERDWRRVAGKGARQSLSRARRRAERRTERWTSSLQLTAARLANSLGYLDVTYSPPGERRRCPACDSAALEQLDVLWHLKRDSARVAGFMSGCRTCGLVFANPLPTPEELAAYYAPESDYVDRRWRRPGAAHEPGEAAADDATMAREQAETVATEPVPSGRRRRRTAAATTGDAAATRLDAPISPPPEQRDKLAMLFASVADQVDVLHPAPGMKAFDYGCGPGRVLDRLKAAGWGTAGLEPALKSAFTRHQELTEPPAEPTFDLVIVHHVLEHLLNPLEVLRQLAASMVDGGIIYISVPRLDAIGMHGDLRYCINSHGHVMSYTRASMTALLAMAGLQAIEPVNDRQLDDLLTGGEPRRMRVFARKTAGARVPAAPLDAAITALRDYRARFEPPSRPLVAALPVRLRAAWLHRARAGSALAHRSQKLATR